MYMYNYNPPGTRDVCGVLYLRVLIMRRRQTFEKLRWFSNVCRLRIIKTRTERGRPGTEAKVYYNKAEKVSSCTLFGTTRWNVLSLTVLFRPCYTMYIC